MSAGGGMDPDATPGMLLDHAGDREGRALAPAAAAPRLDL
jgi:hypothetical protein